MALSLTCACGARFELDETLAGQSVACPECQQPVKVPGLSRLPPRTSACALASAVLATVGAFTVVGTVAAIGFGVAGLIAISRNRGRLTGSGLAAFGILAGALFTALTLFALGTNELFGLGGWWRERNLGGHLDRSGPLEIVDAGAGFAITRPTPRWGRTLFGSNDRTVAESQRDTNLVLLNPALYAFVDVQTDFQNNHPGLDGCQDSVLSRLGIRRARLRSTHDLPPRGGVQRRELEVDVRGRQRWVFLVRLYRTPEGGLYVVRGYSPKAHFERAQGEIRQALDSFRLLGRP